MGGIGAVLDDELALARASAHSARAIILVEGESDRRALEVIASRSGRDLGSEPTVIVAMAGATNIRRFLEIIPPGVILSGLYDDAEEGILRGGLEFAGIAPSAGTLELIGFYRCTRDLEEELIRGAGVETVLEVIDGEGDLGSWMRFCNQPAQRDRPAEARLHRFLRTRSGRNIEYAGLLAERIDLSDGHSPLLRVLSHTGTGVEPIP